MMSKYRKPIILIIIIILIFLSWYFDLFKYLNISYIEELKAIINSFGLLAPIIFIIVYILATILFLPGLPLTLLGGLVFGPITGAIIVSISSTLGALSAFLIGRYVGREWITNKFSQSSMFVRINQGLKNQGWKMIAITRLIPIFPFNAQNYIYGLTAIDTKTYTLVSWLFMLPGTIAYVFLAGAIIGGDGNITQTISYIGIALAILIALSLIGKKLKTKVEKENI